MAPGPRRSRHHQPAPRARVHRAAQRPPRRLPPPRRERRRQRRDAAGTSEAGPASEDSVPGGATPAGPAVSGSIHLTMPLTAFLGSGREPGEVAGHGPVDAATSRDLAAILARSAAHPVVPHPHRPRRPRGGPRLRPARPRRRAARHPVGRRPARPPADPRDRQLPPPPPRPRLRPARHSPPPHRSPAAPLRPPRLPPPRRPLRPRPHHPLRPRRPELGLLHHPG